MSLRGVALIAPFPYAYRKAGARGAMICQDCKGKGWVRPPFPVFTIRLPRITPVVPCEGCGGSGIASCCEGAVGCAGDVTNVGRAEWTRQWSRE